MPIQFKRDPYLVAFATLIVLVTTFLIWHKDVTFKEGAAFITGALAMPALFGKKNDDDPPPKGPSVLPAVLLCLALASSSLACKTGVTPRETARGTVLVVGDAVRQLDLACAAVVYAKKDEALEAKCADAYDVARKSLISAEKAIDAYESAEARDLPCAIAHAVEGLKHMADAFAAAGGKSPPIVDDAFKLAPLLTAGCRG